MTVADIKKRLWIAPNNHVYFGWFGEKYSDHLLDVSELLDMFYTVSIPAEVCGDIEKLVVSFFMEVTRLEGMDATIDADKAFRIAEPSVWFVRRLRHCIVDDSVLIDDYKKAMGLPIETYEEESARFRYLNNIK